MTAFLIYTLLSLQNYRHSEVLKRPKNLYIINVNRFFAYAQNDNLEFFVIEVEAEVSEKINIKLFPINPIFTCKPLNHG
mgnify:CR=1 FL=1